MRKATLASLLAVLALGIAFTGSGLAFAQTNTDITNAVTNSISAAFTGGGTGMLAGALVSFIRVVGKNLQGPGEPLVITKLLITTAFGFSIGIIGKLAGFSELDTVTSAGFITWVLTQVIFPVFQSRVWKAK